MAISYGLLIDWINTGSFTGDNLADDLLQWTTKRGQDYYLSQGGQSFEPLSIGKASLLLDNTGGHYDPYNTSGDFYGHIEPGKLIQFTANVDGGGDVEIFTGWVNDIRINRRDKTVTLDCVDGIAALNNAVADIALQTDTNAGAMITAIISAISYPALYGSSIATGIDTIPYFWTSGVKAKTAVEELVNGTLGYFFCAADGVLTYYTRRIADTVAYTLEESVLNKDIILSTPWENRRNIINIEVAARELAASTQQIWSYAERKRLAIGESITLWAEYTYNGEPVPAQSVAAPVVVANTREDGAGLDISSDIGITSTAYSTRTVMTLTNNSTTKSGYLTSITIGGKPLTIEGRSTVVENGTGYDTNPRPLYLRSKWLQDYNVALGFAEFLVNYLNKNNPYIIATMEGRAAVQLAFELYQRIRCNFDALNIDNHYRLMSIEHESLQTTQAIRTRLKLIPAYDNATTRFFTLDTSELDGPDILAW